MKRYYFQNAIICGNCNGTGLQGYMDYCRACQGNRVESITDYLRHSKDKIFAGVLYNTAFKEWNK